ncbi:MAG: histidine phosphatase family protein [Actinomycetota bacterium]|nr:MAG: histidine phosphatase family protein [Actinomycetota bacterium]
MSGRRLVLWRHGRTSWNATQRFQGHSDIELDAVGIAQAERAADLLALLEPDVIVSSDLVRACRTAQALADRVGVAVDVDADLRETYAGEWEGLGRPELLERFGDQLLRWSAGEDLRPGGGETRTEVAARMHAAIDRALARVPVGGTLVVVTHGGSARAVIGSLLGLQVEQWAALGVLSNCAWCVLAESSLVSGSGWRLVEYNAGSLPQPALADDR